MIQQKSGSQPRRGVKQTVNIKELNSWGTYGDNIRKRKANSNMRLIF